MRTGKSPDPTQSMRFRLRRQTDRPDGREWTDLYDGGQLIDEVVGYDRRLRGEAFDASLVRQPPRAALVALRRSPVRHGLIGLAVAGTASPIAIYRYQQALRSDPSHESLLAYGTLPGVSSDDTVSGVWKDLQEIYQLTSEDREAVIEDSLDRYSEYRLSRELAERIYDVATENDIDPAVAYGLVRAESSFRNTSTSPVGAIGLTQLMPRTAQWLEPGVTRAELREPDTNLRIGFKYLKSLITKYDGNTNLALVAYNRGPGTVDREIRNGRNPDNGYADFVNGKEDHGHALYTDR